MKKIKKILIISMIIILIALITIILVNVIDPKKNNDKKDKEEETTEIIPSDPTKLDENQKYVIENVKQLNAYFVDSTKTKKDFATLTGQSENFFIPMVGSNSNEGVGIIEAYKDKISEDLSSYQSKHQTYLKNLENQIIANYKYELVGNPLYTEDRKQLMQQLKVTPYNYALYQRDLAATQEHLLKLANIKTTEENAETVANIYKAKVKAMEILDAQLNNYQATTTYETNIVYDVGKKITCYSCSFYLNYAWGEYAEEVKMTDTGSIYETLKETRVNTIVETAVNSGKLDKNNPLNLS